MSSESFQGRSLQLFALLANRPRSVVLTRAVAPLSPPNCLGIRHTTRGYPLTTWFAPGEIATLRELLAERGWTLAVCGEGLVIRSTSSTRKLAKLSQLDLLRPVGGSET